MGYTTNRLEHAVNTLADLRNRGQWNLTQIVPHAAIRKIDLNNGSYYGSFLRHLKHMNSETVSKYLSGREGKDLADTIAAEVLKRGDPWNLKLNEFVVQNLNDPALKSGKDLQIFSGYYAPFFKRQESTLQEIAKTVEMGIDEVIFRLDAMDKEFFVETQEHLDTPPYTRRKEDPRTA